ncbi:uncharacterized protein LOC132701862 [Cylas formicarius]|uniref:uncharacterized protein LOC132701862 n=1 Tax=Cylas formicarius TaxID=197179 RepID=UPI002958CD47|nr:uncharacterized protein LOC132701862 [Cylas formicarius]
MSSVRRRSLFDESVEKKSQKLEKEWEERFGKCDVNVSGVTYPDEYIERKSCEKKYLEIMLSELTEECKQMNEERSLRVTEDVLLPDQKQVLEGISSYIEDYAKRAQEIYKKVQLRIEETRELKESLDAKIERTESIAKNLYFIES